MKIRGFREADTAVLARLHSQLFPNQAGSPPTFARQVARWQQSNGRFWAAADDSDKAVGYAALTPVPGLPRLAELVGGVVPSKRRQGYGRYLFHHILQEIAATPYRQLSVKVPGKDSSAARFLHSQGFFIEHEEWVLVKEQLAKNNDQTTFDNRSLFIVHFDRETAVVNFLSLYTKAFAPHPWYQPYTRDEVDAALDDPTNLLFLQDSAANSSIGFAWLNMDGPVGEIEPIGIVPAWQGKGYGRFLLSMALHQLAQRGAESAQITAWSSNAPAIHLYQSLGFRHTHTHTYLAYNLV